MDNTTQKTGYKCSNCGSENIVFYLNGHWDNESQSFTEIDHTDSGDCTCRDCGTDGTEQDWSYQLSGESEPAIKLHPEMKPYSNALTFSEDDYNMVKGAILKVWNQYDKQQVLNNYETGNFIRADRVKNLQERFVWDFYYIFFDRDIKDQLALYNDDHIDTVLNRLLPKVVKRYGSKS